MTGTERIPQCRSQQIATLEDAGIAVVSSLPEATLLAAALIRPLSPATQQHTPSLLENVAVINIGLRSFALELQSASKPVVHYQWSPVAGVKTGSFIRTFAIRVPMFTSVAQANAAVIEQIRRARPHWLDVQPASSLISELNEGQNTASRRAANALAGDDRTHERGVRGRMSVRRLGER